MSLKYFEKSYVLPAAAGAITDDTFFINKHTLTLAGVTAGDSFTINDGVGETAAIVAGTNMTAAAIQALVRTLTGDTGATVTGTTDAGPFVIVPTKASGSNLVTKNFSHLLTATNETGMTVTEAYSIQDVLYVPKGSFYDTTMTGFATFGRARATGVGAYDVSAYGPGLYGFKGQPPFSVRRVAFYQTTGSGATFELKDVEWGTEIIDESPADVTPAAPQPVNGLLLSGDAFEPLDQLDLYLWYESSGDQRF